MAYDVYYLQVRDNETGAEYPIVAAAFNRDLHTRLDGPPIHPQTGAELPMKPHTTVARAAERTVDTKTTVSTAAETKSGQKAASERNN